MEGVLESSIYYFGAYQLSAIVAKVAVCMHCGCWTKCRGSSLVHAGHQSCANEPLCLPPEQVHLPSNGKPAICSHHSHIGQLLAISRRSQRPARLRSVWVTATFSWNWPASQFRHTIFSFLPHSHVPALPSLRPSLIACCTFLPHFASTHSEHNAA